MAVTTRDGSALAGTDYTAVDTILSWESSETASKQVTVPTSVAAERAGARAAEDPTLSVTIESPSAFMTLGDRSSALGTITPRENSGPGNESDGQDAGGSGGNGDSSDPGHHTGEASGGGSLASTGTPGLSPWVPVGTAAGLALVALGTMLSRRTRENG